MGTARSDESEARALARLVVERGLLAPEDLAEAGSIGRYAVVRPLGAGASGQVFLARDPLLDRSVAVKLTDRRVPEERVRQELRLLARLDHPGVVAVHDAGVHEGRLFLVLAYVEGPTLAASDLPLRAWVDVLARVLEACHDVHLRGVVHRDLKPSNILLGPDGPKIADFGVAKLLADDGPALTRAGQLVGTPAYMAPEQAGVGEVSPRTDVFAAGAMLYERLCGVPPYDGGSALDVAARLARGDPPAPPSARRPDVPPALERVALRALAHAPADRFPTAEAMARELRAWLDGAGPAQPRRVGRLVSAIAVGAIAVGAIAVGVIAAGALTAGASTPTRTAGQGEAAPAEPTTPTPTPPTPTPTPPTTPPAGAITPIATATPAAPGDGGLDLLPTPGLTGLPATLAAARERLARARDPVAAAAGFVRLTVRVGLAALEERWPPTGELAALVALSAGGALRDPEADAVVQAAALALRWWFERDPQGETSTSLWNDYRRVSGPARSAGRWEAHALAGLAACFALQKQHGRLAQRWVLREHDEAVAGLQAAGQRELADALRRARGAR